MMDVSRLGRALERVQFRSAKTHVEIWESARSYEGVINKRRDGVEKSLSENQTAVHTRSRQFYFIYRS